MTCPNWSSSSPPQTHSPKAFPTPSSAQDKTLSHSPCTMPIFKRSLESVFYHLHHSCPASTASSPPEMSWSPPDQSPCLHPSSVVCSLAAWDFRRYQSAHATPPIAPTSLTGKAGPRSTLPLVLSTPYLRLLHLPGLAPATLVCSCSLEILGMLPPPGLCPRWSVCLECPTPDNHRGSSRTLQMASQ